MNNIKICFDPGHYGYYNGYGSKPDGEQYYESRAMMDLALRLNDAIPNSILIRYDGNDISLTDRGRIAAYNDCDYFISLHTNSSPETSDKNSKGVEVYYSVDISEDREIGERLIALIEKHTGIRADKAMTRMSTNYPGEDYYTAIDNAQDRGVPHVFLLELGSHWQFGSDYDNNVNGCVDAFMEFFGYSDSDMVESWCRVDVSSVLNMRNSPSTKGDIITQIPKDEIVKAIGANYDKWLLVEWDNYTGWVYSDYLELLPDNMDDDICSRIKEIIRQLIELLRDLDDLV